MAAAIEIPPTYLSALNNDKPMTPEMAHRIIAAVPGISLADLGYQEPATPLDVRPALRGQLVDAEEEVERSLQELGDEIDELRVRVEALESVQSRRRAR